MGFAAGDTNLYRYVGNNPTNAVDSSGTEGQIIYTKLGRRTYLVTFPDTHQATVVVPEGTTDIEAHLRGNPRFSRYFPKTQDQIARENPQLPAYGAQGLTVETDLQNIPVDRVEKMVAKGLAQADSAHPGYVYVVDITPGGVRLFVLIMTENGNYKIVKSITYPDKVPNPEGTLKSLRRPEAVRQNIEGYISDRRNRAVQQWAGRAIVTMKFIQHALPGGAAVDAAIAGDWWEVGFSVAGDAAMLFSLGLSKLSKISASTAAKYRLVGAGIQTGVGGVRTTQGILATIEGDDEKAAGYFGEATLRLLGATDDVLESIKGLKRARIGAAATGGSTASKVLDAAETGIGPQRQVLAADRRLISRTGVETFDKLAKDSPTELQAFLDKVQENGWIVKATDKLDPTTPAQFFPRKGRFYYDPERMTLLDLHHEAKHLELFQQRGNWKVGGGQLVRDEIEAYSLEYELGKQHGFSKEYMEYLERQIGYYKGRLSPEISGAVRPSTMPDPFFKRLKP